MNQLNAQIYEYGYKPSDYGLRRGEAVRKTWDGYITSQGDTLRVGDTLTIGKPGDNGSHFAHITQGGQSAHAKLSGTDVIIWHVKVFGNDKAGYSALIGFKGYGLVVVYVNYEQAMDSGELKGRKGVLTSEEALQQLKLAKDKLDLGLIESEEYERIKERLKKLIK